MTRRSPLPLAALAASVAAAPSCAAVPSASHEYGPAEVVTVDPATFAERVIDARDIRRSVEFLTGEDLEGRGPGSGGLQRSAAWMAERLRVLGLEPAGDHGGFLQYWPWHELGPDSTVHLPNVVARLPGGSLAAADEYVIVMAHFDGPGLGAPDTAGDSIYNAAGDNASGVAALIEVAEAFAALPTPPVRPLVFLATSGGEHGRAGADWFAAHPTIALAGAVAVLDLDMIGRSTPDSLFVTGEPGLAGMVTALADRRARAGLGPVTLQEHLAGGAESDPFAALGIPSVRMHTGAREEHGTPSDEAELVDADKVARLARLAFLAAWRLATRDEPLRRTAPEAPTR